MKYQSEYQRNYQRRSPRKFNDLPIEERKLSEVPIKRSLSSPRRRRRRSLPLNRIHDNDAFAVVGPNEKFSSSYLYRLKEPIKDYPRIPKSEEFAILGKNEKLESNVIYPLRKPVINDSPRIVMRRRKHENHSCGIQTELFDPRSRQDTHRNRRRMNAQTEYQYQYKWKKQVDGSINDEIIFDDYAVRNQKLDSKIRSAKTVGVNTPERIEIDVDKTKYRDVRPISYSTKQFRPMRKDETTEYRTKYKPKPQKAFEAEYIPERKPKEYEVAERALSDDEAAGRNIDLGDEFRHIYPYGKLRRWKSEYQSTYKPFWRFDYRNGKWYKDTSANEKGFNPNLFWYKELMSTRKNADQYRANAEIDHFNRDYTFQVQKGDSVRDSYQQWDDDDRSDSVISIDRDLERERIEGERRRERDARRKPVEKDRPRIQYAKTTQTDKSSGFSRRQIGPIDHLSNRIIYIDEPLPKEPSVATKAFVRNLRSSIQQHMSWDSQSACSQESTSDIKYSKTDYPRYRDDVIYKSPTKRQEPRVTETYPEHKYSTNVFTSPRTSDRSNQQNEIHTNVIPPPPPTTTSANATGRPSYDAQTLQKRPQTSINEYCTYPANRFKDEVTEYYYRDDDYQQKQRHTSTIKPSLQNYSQTYDEKYGRTYNTQNKDDDVLSVHSARSLSSSCSLASQTLERAQQNMDKYWGENSPKKKILMNN